MYTRLNNDLNQFLNTFEISTHTCDVFEEVVLDKLASIATKPVQCKFGPVSQDVMYFKVKGISDEEAEQFLKFLEKSGDEQARKDFIKKPANGRDIKPDEIYEAYVFYVSTEVVYRNLFPEFKYKIVELNENPTERFLSYIKQSEDDDNVKLYKLLVLLDGVLKQMGDLENKCGDTYTKGELHIIFKLLRDRLMLYKSHLPHGCGQFDNDVRDRIGLFEETIEENTFLQEDDMTTKLKKDLDKIRDAMPVPQSTGIHTFGLFNQSSNASTSIIEEEFENKRERGCCNIM